AEGFTSYKLFTTYEGIGLDDAAIYDVMRACGEHGAVVFVHCENDTIVRRRTQELLDAGKTEPRWHPLARPAAAEDEAIGRGSAGAGGRGGRDRLYRTRLLQRGRAPGRACPTGRAGRVRRDLPALPRAHRCRVRRERIPARALPVLAADPRRARPGRSLGGP